MKTLKLTSALAIIVALLFSFTACKKDKNDGPGGGGSGYIYNGTTYKVASANEKHIGGDIFLELTSTDPGDYLQISFANVTAIPEGTLTYHGDRFQGYNAQTNFWATAIGLSGNSINTTGGIITVSKTDGAYKIDLNIQTANGNITGQYNGTPAVTN
ncbi:hypothetical protein D0C36_04240 [Mucilaginibacter conchicola]|uniref:Uncharacterized protein n=1 Tax=Mucilaginibacter conchicola TaxID=2303333 RepID=A0A372NXA6_9SPHI|nr:hypothetical protein [Mucilaginibacter conchicola]RFZ94753.1 hypothetical protein D0C36_04240 [Mucilaginibacter conchicola]